MIIYAGMSKDSLNKCCLLEDIKAIDDSNELQTWNIPLQSNTDADTENVSMGHLSSTRFLRIVFPASTDFFGRVTIYKLKVYGSRN